MNSQTKIKRKNSNKKKNAKFLDISRQVLPLSVEDHITSESSTDEINTSPQISTVHIF